MNFELLVPLLVTTLVAFVGWIIGHILNTRRDRLNKHHELRLQYLVSAYRKLESAAGRTLKQNQKETAAFEEAVADIQLFGTQVQVESLLRNLRPDGNLNEVVNLLRDELRNELDLPKIDGNVFWIRYDKP